MSLRRTSNPRTEKEDALVMKKPRLHLGGGIYIVYNVRYGAAMDEVVFGDLVKGLTGLLLKTRHNYVWQETEVGHQTDIKGEVLTDR